MPYRSPISRRSLFALGGAGAAAAWVAPRSAVAACARISFRHPLLEKAKAALDAHQDLIVERDRIGIADFARSSRELRFTIADLHSGIARSYRVAHGRGSDPDHSGWLQAFSNVPDSLATSRGAYLTGEEYDGKHGRSRRLTGLDATNNEAADRAIVIHGAWYANDDMIDKWGKLGRSEGCFAFAEAQLSEVVELLGPGRLLFADKV